MGGGWYSFASHRGLDYLFGFKILNFAVFFFFLFFFEGGGGVEVLSTMFMGMPV